MIFLGIVRRVLIYVSDYWDLLFAGRQYPFNSDYGMEIVRKELLIRLKEGTLVLLRLD